MKKFIFLLGICFIAGVGNAEWREAADQPVTPYLGTMSALSERSGISAPFAMAMASSEIPDTETTITPEIEAMARALKYNLVDIFEYVRNEIDFVPTYGLYNGATGCLLAGRGNDWDQSALLIALLRASGYTAEFGTAYVYYPVEDVQAWLNVESDVMAASVLSKGGRLVYGGGEGVMVFRRTWVDFYDDGTWSRLDPAIKEYSQTVGIDLQAAMGYEATNFLAYATVGATLGSDYVEQINESNICDRLISYVTNLVHTIQSDHANRSIGEIVGGSEIVHGSFVMGLPYALGLDSGSYQYFAQVPAVNHMTLRIQHRGIDQTLKGYEFAGKRITLFYDETDGYKPLLKVDGNLMETGTATTQNSTNDFSVFITQPEEWGATVTTNVFDLICGGKYLIAHDFESSSKKITQFHNKALQKAQFENAAADSEEIVGGGMQITIDAGLEAWRLSYELLAQLADVRYNLNYFVGILGWTDHGYYVDLPLIQLANTPRTSGGEEDSFFESAMYLVSGLEHGTLEQSQGADRVCASTIKLMQINNADGGRTYLADNNNWSSVRSSLTNYTSSILQTLDLDITNGRTLLLPKDANIGLLEWTGIGYIYVGGNYMGMMIKGGYSGGYGADSSWEFSSSVSQNTVGTVQISLPDPNRQITTSIDPIDLNTGDFLYDRVDLSMGNIAFSRHYNGGQSGRKGPLGYGWTHGYEIAARRVSHPAPALGSRRAEDAAAQIVQGLVLLDLMKGEADVARWTTAILTTKWGVDQLIENAVTVQIGSKSLEYIELPDGSYSPPPGETAALEKDGDHFVLNRRFDEKLTFNPDGTIGTWLDADSKGLNFAYNASTNLQTVTDRYGRTLTLSYTNDLVSSVSDSSGRSVSYQYADDNLTAYIDSELHEWNFGYSDTNNPHLLSTLQDPLSQITASNSYNRLGQVDVQRNGSGHDWEIFITGPRGIEQDPEGGMAQHHFDDRGRNVAAEDELHNVEYNAYDGEGHRTLNIDPNFNVALYRYDANHNLTNRIDALDGTWKYEYDSEHRLTKQTDPLDRVTEYEYDTSHHLILTTDPLDGETVRTYYTSGTHQGLLNTLTDPNGNLTTYTYDSFGNPDTITSTDAGTVDFDYNARGELIQKTDARGKITEYTYDDTGNPLIAEFPDGSTVSNAYYANGLLEQTTDGKGETTTTTWTPTYKQSTITYPDGSVVSNHYDTRDWLVAVTDPQGNTVSNSYDAAGRVIATSSVYSEIDNAYDPNGNITNSTIDPSGLNLWAVTEYDDLNRLVVTSNSLSRITRQYDSLSQLTNRTDAASKNWGFEYDELGRKTKNLRPTGAEEQFVYDALGNRIGFHNAEDKPVIFGFDAQRRVTSITNAIGRVIRLAFDENGNMTNRLDAMNRSAAYIFDEMNRIDSVEYPDATEATFDYDPNGNLVEQIFLSAQTQFGYDEMNRLTVSTQSVYSVSSVVQNSYDLNGNRTNIVYPGGLVVSYEYGADNRLESVTTKYTNDTKTTSFNYDSASRMTNIVYPNSVVSSFGYDAESRVISFSHNNGSNFVERSMIRDPRGYKTSENIISGLEPEMIEGEQRFENDDADRLTKITQRDTWLGSQLEQWYDRDYTYNDNGCLTQEDVSRPSWNTNSAIYEYTADYTWDYDNRLTGATGGLPYADVEYLYDASGSRIARIHTNGGTVTTNYFVVDSADGLKRPLAETDASGAVTRYYVWAGFRLLAHIDTVAGGGDPGGTVRYYHQDELSSTLALTDETGTVTDEFAYMPYGYATHTGSTETPYRWLGGYGVYYDADTDLHLTLHRAYSSKMKRFISSDPMGIDGGVNLYAYGNLNPVYFVDPSGEVAWVGAIGGAVGGFASELLLQGAANLVQGDEWNSDLDWKSVWASTAIGAGSGAVGVGVITQGKKAIKATKVFNHTRKTLKARKIAMAAGKFRNPVKTALQISQRNQALRQLGTAVGRGSIVPVVKNTVKTGMSYYEDIPNQPAQNSSTHFSNVKLNK